MSPERQPADLPALIGALASHEVSYVISGSVAAMLHGVELTPRDLDVVPDLASDKLPRLFALLAAIEARPYTFGHWQTRADGERGWVEDETTPEALAAWRPRADDVSTFDQLYRTAHGDLDVVPEITGDYQHLAERAVERELHGHQVRIAHIDDLLAKLTVPRRERDAERVRQLRTIQRGR